MGFCCCRARCERFRVKKTSNHPYEDGLKYCVPCGVWVSADEQPARCPCCSSFFRTRTRDHDRRKLEAYVAKRY